MTSKQIQAALKGKRQVLRLSQTEVGNLCELGRSTIHNLEGGKENVTLPLIVKYAESMGLEVIIRQKNTWVDEVSEFTQEQYDILKTSLRTKTK